MTSNTLLVLLFAAYWLVGLGISVLLYIYWHDVNSSKSILFKRNEIATDYNTKNFILESVAANNQIWILTLFMISFFWLPLVVAIVIKKKK